MANATDRPEGCAAEEAGCVTDIGRVVPRAPEGMRYVGFCRSCRSFVELGPTFGCLKGGHPKDDIAVALLLDDDDPLPELPRMNWGAFFMPALWGPAHGQWYMVLFYPIWLLLDNLVYGTVHGSFPIIVPIVAVAGALAFMAYYALRANAFAYQRVAAEKTPEQFVATERKWTILFVIIGIVFIVFATWYNVAIRPTLPVV